MAQDFTIQGVEQLAALAKRLKEIGDGDLSREFSKSVTAATKPLTQAIRQSARDTLPSRGGLAERVAKSQIRTQRRASSRTTGIRVVGRNPYAIGRLNRGEVRHPVFGSDRWVTQTVKPGWWSNPTERMAPEVRMALVDAMETIKRKLDARLS